MKTRKPRAKKAVETPIEVPVEVAPETPIEESAAKEEFRAFIDKLKAENMPAYLKNEAELNSKLNQL